MAKHCNSFFGLNTFIDNMFWLYGHFNKSPLLDIQSCSQLCIDSIRYKTCVVLANQKRCLLSVVSSQSSESHPSLIIEIDLSCYFVCFLQVTTKVPTKNSQCYGIKSSQRLQLVHVVYSSHSTTAQLKTEKKLHDEKRTLIRQPKLLVFKK